MERKFHPRLILIDGINVMKEFKEHFDVNQNKANQRMNPMALVPLVNGLQQNGFRLRIVMEKMPSKEEVENRYILKEFARLNILLFSRSVCYKSHDLFMLSMADEYGAMIISNDTFETHYHQYKNVIEKNTIQFMKNFDNGCISEIYESDFDSRYSLSFCDDFDKFYCYDDDPDYGKVKLSHIVFRLLSASNIKILDILLTYIYARFCLKMGCSRPAGLLFLKEDEELPARYEEFKFRCLSCFC